MICKNCGKDKPRLVNIHNGTNKKPSVLWCDECREKQEASEPKESDE